MFTNIEFVGDLIYVYTHTEECMHAFLSDKHCSILFIITSWFYVLF